MLGRKVIFVRSINCSYNNVAKSISLLDKSIFCLYRKNFMQVTAFERYVSLKLVRDDALRIGIGIEFQSLGTVYEYDL